MGTNYSFVTFIYNPAVKEDDVPAVVDNVDRDEYKNQLMDTYNKKRVRTSPNLKGTIIGYLKANKYYDWFGTSEADGYTWYKLADNQWAAATATTTIYPKKDIVEELEKQVTELTLKVDLLTNKITKAIEDLA